MSSTYYHDIFKNTILLYSMLNLSSYHLIMEYNKLLTCRDSSWNNTHFSIQTWVNPIRSDHTSIKYFFLNNPGHFNPFTNLSFTIFIQVRVFYKIFNILDYLIFYKSFSLFYVCLIINFILLIF